MSGGYFNDNRLQTENYKLRKQIEKFQSEEYLSNLTNLHAEELAKKDRKIALLEKKTIKLAEQNRIDQIKISSLKVKLENAELATKALNSQLRGKNREISALQKQNLQIEKIIQDNLIAQEEIIKSEVIKRESILQAELADKEGLIKKLSGQINRDYKNSSIPTSKCMVRGTIHNGREKTGRKPGGQNGHEGHHRKKHIPTSQVTLEAPCACVSCASKKLKLTGKSRTRQQVDLKVVVNATDFISHEYECEECGANFHSKYPTWLPNEVNYGPDVKTLASILNNYCNVSLDKTAEVISEITGGALKISKGTLSNLSKEFSNRVAEPIEEIIRDFKQSPVSYTDSSNGRVNGINAFFHVFVNLYCKIYLANAHKGIAALAGSPIDDYAGIIVHDHDLTYYHFGGDHQECNVHILRYLLDAMENEPNLKWHSQMRELLLAMNNARKVIIHENRGSFDLKDVAIFKKKYNEILDMADNEYLLFPPTKYIYKGFNLARRLRKYERNHLLFLDNIDVPFDNNLSERTVRVAKGKLKVIGTFRSMTQGMQIYCDFLTIIETAKARGFNIFQTIRNVYNGEKDIWAEPI